MACSRCGQKTKPNLQINRPGTNLHPSTGNSTLNTSPSSVGGSVKEAIAGLKYVPKGK